MHAMLHPEKSERAKSAQDIVDAAEQYAKDGTVFEKGCSDMVRSAYQAGEIVIPTSYDANAILKNYTSVDSPLPGDVAGWEGDPHGHVVIYIRQNRYANCPGEGEATKINTNMGQELVYVRPA